MARVPHIKILRQPTPDYGAQFQHWGTCLRVIQNKRKVKLFRFVFFKLMFTYENLFFDIFVLRCYDFNCIQLRTLMLYSFVDEICAPYYRNVYDTIDIR
jgi:hypothetical protein